MGCFLDCFGGDADRRRRRRKSRKQSPASSPPRSIHVAVAREAADVVVKEVSPPLRGAKPSTLAEAVEVPDEAVAVAAKEASLPSHEMKASTPPSAVAAADEAGTNASPVEELRDLSEQKVLEKQAAPSLSPVKFSPIVAAIVSSQESVECSPVVAVVVSALDSDPREVNGHDSRSSGKKKVTLDMNVTTYENAVPPDQEEEPPEEDENYVQNTVVLPENHRYRNCSDNDDVGDEYAGDGVYGDDSDEDEEEFLDCKIDLVDEEEIRTEENKQESHESLFSLSMSNDQQNDQEVVSPAPKSSGTSVEAESPLIAIKKLRDRCQYVHPVLNPVQNLSQWKEVKSLKAQPVHGQMLDKENVSLVPDVGPSHYCNSASHTRMNSSMSSNKEISLDASLSTWLVSSENSTVDKVQSKSPCSNSSVNREERPILGALTIDDLKQSSAASSPQRSPRTNREGAPILGTVGSYWHCTVQNNEYCSSRSNSGTNGIPNSTSKYREDKRVNWHSTPFNVRLDRALNKTSA
ncbi:unnamed protein product [Miscanthus lutarioriparius]|uniref:Uncharacterized protein n=1 Tax=Miscanthus lutarioriparius TaxID=422564 RepID=A0A811QV96_9POAL|nr:unnamed protein product [Miscanthus lutarioriparius]